jgi:hypothetical protein
VDKRSALVFSLLATQVKSTQDAFDQFGVNLTDKDAQRIEAFTSQIDYLTARFKVMTATVFTSGGIGGGWAAAAAGIDRQRAESEARFNAFLGGAQEDIATRRGDIQAGMGPEFNQTIAAYLAVVNQQLEEQKRLAQQARSEMDKLLRAPVLDPMTGKPFERKGQQRDRSFDLPTISNALPTVQRGAAQVNSELETTVTTLEMIQLHLVQIRNSNAWQVAAQGVQVFTSVLDFQSAALQNQIQIMQQIGQMEQDRWNERAERMREAGLQTSALYRNELREFERSEKERNKATRRLQAKQFEIDKRSRIAGTIMATSEGFMNVFTNPRMPIGLAWVMAALVAAQGAIQIATIAGQQNPYRGFQFGGLVPGGSLGDDNLVRVRGGEYVTTPEATARNRAALEYANSGGTIQPGGASGLTVIIQGNVIGEDTYVRNNLMPAIAKAVRQGYQLQTTASR